MRFVGKLIKPILALALTGALWAFGSRALAAEPAKTPPPKAEAPKAEAPKARVVEMKVTEKGYEPSPLTVKKGEPVKLVITRTTDSTCATEIIMPDYNINASLPLNKPVEVAFTPTKAGTLKYGCAMGMMIAGIIKVE